MDKGLWITWYDLPEDGRDAYLSWLHETYIPALLKRPGFLWAAHYESIAKGTMTRARKGLLHHTADASVPAGDRYILLFGAEQAHVFGNPVPGVLNRGMPEESRKMLAMRIGERVNIMTETARVEGPAAEGYASGMALPPCIQLGSFNCAWRDEEEMLAWYAQWRLPAMVMLPGVIRTRKLASVSGWAKHAVLYEWVSLEARNEYFPKHEDRNPEMNAWSGRVVQTLQHAPGSANVACRLWPAVAR